MTRRKPLLLLGILAVALCITAGVSYFLLHREPVYGGKPRSYWKEHLAEVEYELVPPPGWLQGLVWKVNPWKKRTVAGSRPLDTCEASFVVLVQMMSDPDRDLRRLSLSAIAAHYRRSPERWAIFLRAIRDPDAGVQWDAISGLEQFRGKWTPGMVEDCLGLLSDRDRRVRQLARSMYPFSSDAREALTRALQHRAKTRTLNANEASLLQELQQTPTAAPEGPSP
jgi:hypothetical protein